MPNPTPLNQPVQMLSANLVSAEELKNELNAAKEAAKSDGHHNAVIVDKTDPEEPAVYNLAVSQEDYDKLSLNQSITTGKIQGTIKFLDNGNDDGVSPTNASTPAAAEAVDPMYSLSLKEASNTVMALEVLLYGGESDVSKMQQNFSERERTEGVKAFQKSLGVEVTGQWDVASFAAAKALLIEEYDDEENLTDGQFRHVIDDLQRFAAGDMTGDQVMENLDEYMYEGRQTPYLRSIPSDSEGYQALRKELSNGDQLKMVLALSDFEQAEIAELAPVLEGQDTPELRAMLEENYFEVAELEAQYPGKSLSEAIQHSMIVELQEYIDMPEAEWSGEFDQQTYDALLNDMYDQDTPDIDNSQFTQAARQIMRDNVAYAKGEIDLKELRSRYNEAMGEEIYDLSRF